MNTTTRTWNNLHSESPLNYGTSFPSELHTTRDDLNNKIDDVELWYAHFPE